ncbi:hypothetical protein SAMN04487981_101599 [Streptomyces sp. cf386]|uniref:hypothetical protein n=1 Tax=Streptomyces sp. cf386 TaxID=1761904 RepID=UPI00088FBF5B|nr:hypothetical protein [Streptomyces sp. cf386]SDM46216.1 hypothetical protein SAMN04487981_101599 [Streptomyces sp. cf386]
MAYPTAKIEIFVGGQWVDITDDVYLRARISITQGRRDQASRPGPARCRFYLKNTAAAKYSPVNPTGEYYGLLNIDTPVRVSVNPAVAQRFRFFGDIPSFPLERNRTDKDRWVAVDAFGPLYGLQRRSAPPQDTLRRHIDAHGPLAYWPGTDGENAIQGTEVTGGGSPLRSVGEAGSFYQGQPNWGRGQLASWLDPVVELPAQTIGYVTATISPRTINAWSVDHVVNSRGPGNVTSLQVYDTGAQSATVPRVEWRIDEWGSGSFNQVQLRITERLDASSTTAILATINAPGIYDGGVHHLRLKVTDDGAGGLAWELYIDGISVASGTRATVFRPLEQAVFRWSLVEGGGVPTESVPFGHLTYWGPNAPAAIDTWRAVQGHVRELAGRRIERLCAEQSVPLQVNGDLDTSPAMGPQRPGKFLDLLASAAAVDGGVLHEARDEFALAYRTNASRYNQGL